MDIYLILSPKIPFLFTFSSTFQRNSSLVEEGRGESLIRRNSEEDEKSFLGIKSIENYPTTHSSLLPFSLLQGISQRRKEDNS